MRWRSEALRRTFGLVLTIAGSVLLALVLPPWLWSGVLALMILGVGIMLWRT